MPAAQLRMLYDGQCPLCRREMEELKRRDAKGLILPEDISDPAFNPARYGLTAEQVQTLMHLVLPDGRVLRAMDAVRARTLQWDSAGSLRRPLGPASVGWPMVLTVSSPGIA